MGMERRNFLGSIGAVTIGLGTIGTASADREIVPAIGEVESVVVPSYENPKRYRPVPSGVNESNINSDLKYATNGPYFFEVTDTSRAVWGDGVAEGDKFRASNNHVYARTDQASIGEGIVQPAKAYAGDSDDIVGELTGYVPLGSEATSDVAFRSATPTDELLFYKRMDMIPEQGVRGGYTDLGTVKKTGVTSGVTTGTVTGRGSITVDYDSGPVDMNNVIVVKGDSGPFIEGGDSGAPVVDSNGDLIGLAFAYLSGTNYGYVIPLSAIEEDAGVEFVGAGKLRQRLDGYDYDGDGDHDLFDALEAYNDDAGLFTALDLYNNEEKYSHWDGELESYGL